MSAVVSTHSHHTWKKLALAFAIPILLGVGWFVWQTISYIAAIRTGTAVSIADRRMELSIGSAVANANVTDEDRARLTAAAGNMPELGARDARVTVVEFVDYQCPYSQRSADAVRRVMEAMGSEVRLIVRDFPILELHPNARRTALAAQCVLEQGQDAYWRFHDELYATEPDPSDGAADFLRATAETVGVRLTDYDVCMSQNRYGKRIDEDISVGLRAGVQGTPTFFINGIKFEGATDEKKLTREINAVMDQLPR